MLAGNIALRLAVTLSSQLFGFYGVLALNAMCGVIALAAMPA